MTDNPMTANPGSTADGVQPFDLREALGFVWRQWKFITAITLLSVVIGTVYLINQTPLFTATTEVLLDRPKAKMPGGEAIAPDLNFLDAAMLQSQVAIVRSTVLLRRVVERANLAPQPAAAAEPASPSEPGDYSIINSVRDFARKLVGGSNEHPAPETAKASATPAEGETIPTAELRAIRALRDVLKVTHGITESNVLAISITSPDPKTAARLANAVADAYLVDKLDTRFDAAKRASAWLSDRLVGLRQQLRESEEAVAQFRADHGLVQSNGASLSQQQVSELNATLIQARADLAQKKARVDLLSSMHAKAGRVETMPDMVQGAQLQALFQQKASLSAQEADLLARYTPSYPLVVNIRAQLNDLDRSIGSQTARLAASIRNEYELAQTRVSSLETQLRTATGQSTIDNTTAVRLRELERTAAANKTLFEDFLKQAKITQEQSTFEPQEVRIITPAVAPGQPSYPQQARFVTMNVIVGLLFGFGAAFAKEKLNSGFTTPKQVEDMLGLPVLTSVSRLSNRDLSVNRKPISVHEFLVTKPLSRYAEAIRSLRSGIHMTDVDHPPKIIQLTSAVPGEGKTTMSLSLAASAALGKLKVLFIDADLRHPTATRVFGLQQEPGLVDLLVGDCGLEAVVQYYEKGGFWVLGCGSKTQNPTDLLGSERMRNLIAGFREIYDLVVLDTPPAGPVSDPVIVSGLSDKVVLVVKWGATVRELVRQSVDQLSGHRKVAGVAFNLVDDREAQKYGKYASSYYYGNRYYKDYYS